MVAATWRSTAKVGDVSGAEASQCVTRWSTISAHVGFYGVVIVPS
jgi:hypothetical protein